MGWQSYFIDVHEITKRILVLEAMKRHDNEPFDEINVNCLAGEQVTGIAFAIHDETKRLYILFGNDGGRSSTRFNILMTSTSKITIHIVEL